jgi:protein-S-isoprenylcysteine O-methyltransferase Ste14
MPPLIATWIRVPWICLCLVWIIAALFAKRTVRTEAVSSRVGHILTVAAAFALLFSPAVRIGPLAWRILPLSASIGIAGLILTIVGIAFAIWARFYLGGNWSAIVEIKQHHRLIQSGPYTIVRHPIYTGLALAVFGTALVVDELGAFLAVVIVFAGWQAKAAQEESFLRTEFGDAYLRYQQQVKMMIPFVL